VNLGGHVIVAAAVHDDPVVHLGAALPDVATVGGFRMVGGAGRGAIGQGIALHHATDAAFHGHEWFTSHLRWMIDSLIAAGVARGAARAAAHVGVELLLDGTLFSGAGGGERTEAVSAAFDRAPGADGLSSLVVNEAQQDWMVHVAGLPRWKPPSYFHDPHRVAHRLHAILAQRPRLAMTSDDVAKVGAALAEVQPSITATAEDFVAELSTRLDADPAWR
jgi:hypothetical protein